MTVSPSLTIQSCTVWTAGEKDGEMDRWGPSQAEASQVWNPCWNHVRHISVCLFDASSSPPSFEAGQRGDELSEDVAMVYKPFVAGGFIPNIGGICGYSAAVSHTYGTGPRF